jgi:hypothetical protein
MNKRTKIIIGVILGVAVIGGIWYYYNKKKQEEPLTKLQKDARDILINNTDV